MNAARYRGSVARLRSTGDYAMLKAGKLRNLAQANRANLIYERAEKDWSRGRVRSAFRLFLAAAKSGSIPALERVGQFYDCGTGVKIDRQKALYWYSRAYRHGSSLSASNIGCIWRDKNSFSRARQWFQRAIRLGDADANLNIAKIYLRKRGDLKKAIYHLEKVRRSNQVFDNSKEEAIALLKELKTRRHETAD
jgi:TPR repeat protein